MSGTSHLTTALVDKLTTRHIDMKGRRVVNASPSVDQNDYVVRKEISDLDVKFKQLIPKKGLANAYTIVFDKVDALVTSELIPAFIVGEDREGSPEEVWIYSRVPAPANVSINFGTILPNGASQNLLQNNLVLPVGQQGPIFYDGPFLFTTFVRGTPIYPLIVLGSNATYCSMGVVVNRDKQSV